MSCCAPTIHEFTNEATTVISYTEPLPALHGATPTVEVYYFNEETGGFDKSQDSTQVTLSGTPVDTITIDHGGAAATGYVLIR